MLGRIGNVEFLEGLLVSYVARMIVAIVIQSFFHGLFITVNDLSVVVSIGQALVVIGMTEFMKNNAAWSSKTKGRQWKVMRKPQ